VTDKTVNYIRKLLGRNSWEIK